jgi:hypothetical protein
MTTARSATSARGKTTSSGRSYGLEVRLALIPPAGRGYVTSCQRRAAAGGAGLAPDATAGVRYESATSSAPRPNITAASQASRPMIDNSATASRTPEPARKLGWRAGPVRDEQPPEQIGARAESQCGSRMRDLERASNTVPSKKSATERLYTQGAPSLLALRAGAARGASHTCWRRS